MCIIKLQNHIIICQEHILTNAMIYQMMNGVKQTTYDHANLTLDEYDYSEGKKKDQVIIKNYMTQHYQKVMKKNLVYHPQYYQKVLKKEKD